MKLTNLLFEETKPKYLFHGTETKNVPTILKDGLLPSKSRSSQKGVYLTNDIFTAENYASAYTDSANWTVLRIDTNLLDIDKLNPDDYELQDWLDRTDDEDRPEHLEGVDSWKDVSWQDSLEYCNQVVYMDKIPPSAISVLKK